MIFTPSEIQLLFNIIDYRMARVVADILGKDFLTPEDRILLLKNGFDIEKQLKNIPTYWQAYLFGRLSSLLTDEQLKTLNYTDIRKYIDRKQYKQPNRRELAEYRAAATRTYSYIKGMGNRIRETLTSSVSEEEIKNTVEERRIDELPILKKEIELGVLEKRSIQNIVSNIGNQTSNWNRDWGRIVETEMQDIYQLGRAQTIMEDHGIDARVYKNVFPGACKFCIKLYTTEGIGSKPKVFKLSSLIANGNNIGRKQKDWKPVLGTVHPFCFNSPFIEITTFDGPKWIKDIKIGDIVLTHNNNYRRVSNVFKRRLPENFKEGIFDIYYIVEDDSQKLGYREEGLHRVTGNHSIFINNRKTEVKNIKKGDILHLEKGLKGKVTHILEIPRSNYGKYLYNFEVEKDHSYFAENVAVSNCRCELHYIPEGYVWDEDLQSFVPPKNYERKVERKSKVKIYVGDKVFES